MNIIPKFTTKYGETIGVELFVDLPDIAENPTTFFSANGNAGISTLSVENGLLFSIAQYAVLGTFGAQNAEIVRTHASTATTATSITLAAATIYSHNRGERVLYIPFNQIEIYKSTDGGVSYSLLTTLGIRPDSTATYYNDTTGTSTTYYKTRFKNAAASTFSEYSDPVIGTGYEENSAGALILKALQDLGQEMDEEILTQKFLLDALDAGRDDIAYHKKIEKMSFRGMFNVIIGRVVPGRNFCALPINLKDPATYKNILNVKIGRDKYPVKQTDKKGIDRWYMGTGTATIPGAVLDTDVTIVLSSTGDLPASGTIAIEGDDVAGTINYVNYTAKDDLMNTISGVTGIQTGGHAAGKTVWVYASFGLPIEYAIVNARMIFNQPFSNDTAGQNIYIDYYRLKVKATSFGDLLDEPFWHIYLPYMRYRIKLRLNPQMQREQDDDFKSWIEAREAQVEKEMLGQDIRVRVDIPGTNSRLRD